MGICLIILVINHSNVKMVKVTITNALIKTIFLNIYVGKSFMTFSDRNLSLLLTF